MAYLHNYIDPGPGVVVSHHGHQQWVPRPCSPELDAKPLDILRTALALNGVNMINAGGFFRGELLEDHLQKLRIHRVEIEEQIREFERRQYAPPTPKKKGVLGLGKTVVQEDPRLAADTIAARTFWRKEKGFVMQLSGSARQNGVGIAFFDKHPLTPELQRQVEQGMIPPPPEDWPDDVYRAPAGEDSGPSGSWSSPGRSSELHPKLQSLKSSATSAATPAAALQQPRYSSGGRSRASTAAPGYVEDEDGRNRIPSMLIPHVDSRTMRAAAAGLPPRADFSGYPPVPVAGMLPPSAPLPPGAFAPHQMGQYATAPYPTQVHPHEAVPYAQGSNYNPSSHAVPYPGYAPQPGHAGQYMPPPPPGYGGSYNPYGGAEPGPGPSSSRRYQ